MPDCDLIAQVALQKLEGLPKTGKPQPHEWTVMAAIVACDTSGGDPALRVLTVATGTKCLGASLRDPGGLALGDCHAEVLTRRALLRYLCAEANHDVATLKSLPATGRTGAKLLVLPKSDGSVSPAVVTDAHASHLGQETARCRRKPGRGESTLSMSCSDKIARWSLLGLQGSLWSALLAAPLALSSVTVLAPLGVDPALTKVALRRALVHRTDALRVKTQLPPPTVHVLAPDPEVLERLALAPLGGRRVSCGASLAWHDGVAAAGPPFHEGLTGGTGLRAGHARKPGPGHPPCGRV
ncbi:hypothetical protein QBZ16_000437 [Prototheca wickerhamii]|uniref:tRNA-specific adenosine deaminase 1 n=1 Tax=Prototheca wickerhamii TaxID=3111 RepID=A0AAD9MN22_PROWI|nr:hypothetical protein QBZ16_000437 [Prototheca wickerhamii]